MLETRIRSPYLGRTPRKIVSADGKPVSVPTAMNLQEFTKFPWPEGQRWELIYGCPIMSPSPLPHHQTLLASVIVLLRQAVAPMQDLTVMPGVDVLLPGTENYLCPDVSVVNVMGDSEIASVPLAIAPSLCVELLSPSTQANDLGAKLDAEAGVPEYWVGNPATGALSIFTSPRDGEYSEQPGDPDGFVVSPLLGRALRIRRDGIDFHIETRQS